MPGDGQGSDSTKPAIYELQPPQWVPQISNAVELGFQGFYPPRPGEDEDQLTDTNIRQGYHVASTVPAEAFTSKALVIGTLTGKDGKESKPIAELGDFMNDILQRREESLPRIPPSTFRIPQRVTLPEAKKQAFFADLANPDIPLHKLGRTIPHCVRGPELLDLLHSSNVPISRAVWFIRVLGFIETTNLKNKPNYNSFQYSVDWGNVMNNYLKRQISEIILPSAPRAGLMIKTQFKGVWITTEARERWVSKISYSLDLLRELYAEYMVDHTTFLTWLVQFFHASNLAQATFISRVALTYTKDILPCRALTKILIESCTSKLHEIYSSAQKELLLQLQSTLVTILRQTFYEAPHAFVNPRIWVLHSVMLKPMLTLEDIDRPNDDAYMKTRVNELKQYLQAQLSDIEQRNDALLFRFTSEPVRGTLRSSVLDAQLLNTITTTTDLRTLDFFGTSDEVNDDLFSRKLDLLLSWCISPLQFGAHRPYAAVTLLRLWRERAEERANIHDYISPRERLQDELFDWLDSSDLAADCENMDSLSLLFGELVESELFSYDAYLQRLIARGEAGLSFEEANASRHRMILRTVPIYNSSAALLNQRKFALYGVRRTRSQEEASEKRMRQQIRQLLPEVFGGTALQQRDQMDLLMQLASMSRARFEQVRVVKEWLMPALRQYLSRLNSVHAERASTSAGLISTIVAILENLKCYRSSLDFLLRIFKLAQSNDLLVVVVDNLRRFAEIWTCMNKMTEVVEAALAVHRSRKSRGEHVRPLVTLILDLDDERYLEPLVRQMLVEEAAHYAKALSPTDDNPDQVPSHLPEVMMLAQDHNPEAQSTLSNALWYKYRGSPHWTRVVWDNVISSLRQVPAIMVTSRDRLDCAAKYARFLLHVDEHCADGVDVHAQVWFREHGQNGIVVMSPEALEVCVAMLIDLVVHGVLKISTLLEGIIYPAWLHATQVDSAEKWISASVVLHAANALFFPLVSQHTESLRADGAMPPSTLTDIQRLKARRKEIYSEARFRRLIDMLPVLVLIQSNEHVDENYRTRAHDLVRELSGSPEFCLATTRYFDIVLATFVKALEPGMFPEELHEGLMTMLHLVFNNGIEGDVSESSKFSTSLLSPWKLPATCALTKIDLRQIAKRMETPSTKEQAEAELTILVERLLHKNLTADEAEFIIEMAKGVNKIVAGKFLNCGVRRISQILSDTASDDAETLQAMAERADRFLTLLSSLAHPNPAKGETSDNTPLLNVDVQNEFLPALLAKLILMENSVRSFAENQSNLALFGHRPPVTRPLLFTIRLVQFDLGFDGAWTAQTRAIGPQLLATILRLAALYGGAVTDSIAFTMLIDTAFYVFDELPYETRQNAVMDIYQHCIPRDESLLPTFMPPSFRELIQTFFRHTINTRTMVNPIDGVPTAQLRPWEWLDYLGDQPLDPKEQIKELEEKKRNRTKQIIRNNASLSLELFDAQVTGESVRNIGGQFGDLRTWMFEDSLAAESIYERSWRNGLVSTSVARDRQVQTSDSSSAARGKRSVSRGGTPFRSSPALSTRSTGSNRPSPFGRDPMDIDNLYPSVAGSKRKASSAGIGEEDDTSQTSGTSQASGIKGKGKGRARQN